MTPHDTLVQHLAHAIAATTSGAASVPMQIVTTHISTIVLVGEKAYKLKRPVRLPFLDYSQLALRYQACLTEYQINQRTAPELYLGICPVLGCIEAPYLGEIQTQASQSPPSAARACVENIPGELLLDWVVVMRRFQAEDLFSHMARHDRLDATHMSALAQHLATFHAQQPPLTESDLAQDQPLTAWFAQSLDEIAQHPHDPSTLSQLAILRDGLAQDLPTLTQRCRERVVQGYVRDCHGDMHLNNITQWQHQVMAFDAIDFDAALRRIDVMDEVAFVLMDLCAHQQRRWAWVFLNQYLHRTGDYSGLKLLTFYVRYRALIRAKVALLEPHHHEIFQGYWQLACQPSLNSSTPRCILVGGLSGSGKSTVASWLSQHLGAIWLRADVERQRLFPQAQQRYSAESSRHLYQHLARLTHNLLSEGYHVVVDATFLDPSHVNLFHDTLRTMPHMAGSRLHALICEAPGRLLQQRIESRLAAAQDPSEATIAVLQVQQQRQQCRPVVWPMPYSIIHNDSSLEALQVQLQGWLNQHP